MSVSIILKTLNEEKRIGAAIESVLVALDGLEGEIIIADSGSKDQTTTIAARYPVTVVQIEAPAKPSCGIGPQLGFQYSTGDYVCLIDGDMILHPNFLKAAIAHLESNPELGGVTGHVNEANLDNLEFTRRVQRNAVENRIGWLDRMNGGGLYRREAIQQAGYFSDRNLHGYEEFDLGLRLREKGWTLFRLDIPFVDHFGHSINAYLLLTRRWKSKYLRGIGELLRGSVARGRLAPLIRELPEVRLWGVVYLWWAVLLVLAIAGFFQPAAWFAFLAILLLPPVAMALKQGSLALGAYAVVAWCFHAAALPLGFFAPRHRPEVWIESKVLHKEARG